MPSTLPERVLALTLLNKSDLIPGTWPQTSVEEQRKPGLTESKPFYCLRDGGLARLLFLPMPPTCHGRGPRAVTGLTFPVIPHWS